MGKIMNNVKKYGCEMVHKTVKAVKKTAVVVGSALCIGASTMDLTARKAFATAPASLSDALTVSLDNTVIWAAMAAVLTIVAGIVAFKYVKHMFGGR